MRRTIRFSVPLGRDIRAFYREVDDSDCRRQWRLHRPDCSTDQFSGPHFGRKECGKGERLLAYTPNPHKSTTQAELFGGGFRLAFVLIFIVGRVQRINETLSELGHVGVLAGRMRLGQRTQLVAVSNQFGHD